jgi:hypothetical protein
VEARDFFDDLRRPNEQVLSSSLIEHSGTRPRSCQCIEEQPRKTVENDVRWVERLCSLGIKSLDVRGDEKARLLRRDMSLGNRSNG